MTPQAAPCTNFLSEILFFVRDVGVVRGKFSFEFQSLA
jgi:hypothetical protein